MRILHLNTEKTWRGGEQQVLYLMLGLRDRGIPQEILCRPGSVMAERAAAEGLPVTLMRMGGEADLPAAWRIARHAKRGGFDILHMHTSHAHTLGVLASRLAGRPRPRTLVARRVDFSIYRHSFLGLNGLKYKLGVDRILCVSERIRQVLLDDGLPASLLGVAHSGIDLARVDGAEERSAALRAELGVPEGVPVIGNVAACADHKGQRYLVEAAPAILAHAPDARIIVVGEGELRPALMEQAKDLGIADRVLFTGFRPDVPSILKMLDIFAFPSHLEGLGTSVLDAMSARLPIAASAAGGIPEMIDDGVHGLLVPPKDPPALAAALIRLLDDEALRARLAAAARERVERDFTWQRTVERTVEEYERLLEGT